MPLGHKVYLVWLRCSVTMVTGGGEIFLSIFERNRPFVYIEKVLDL